MKNMIELNFFLMVPLLIKGLHIDLPTICELFLDVKMKNGGFGEKQKNPKKPKQTHLLQQDYKW